MSNPNNLLASSAHNYTTNVNRTKTTKWVKAPKLDYGGDDWGSDEYNDDEPSPPSKPTGLRQKGQSTQAVTNPAENNKKSYVNISTLPGQNHPRSASALVQKNSFDAGDEKRAFSSYNAPLHISTQQPSTTGFRKASHSELPPVETGKPLPQTSDARQDSQSEVTLQTAATGSTLSYSKDIRDRRDYSLSAVPAPLSALGNAPHSFAGSSDLPPRQSSLTQQARPNFPVRQPEGTPSPWNGAARSNSTGPPASYALQDSTTSNAPGMLSARSPPTSPSVQKPLPFVRPADIYKRMAEEKIKESQDSSRPSMESQSSNLAPDKSPVVSPRLGGAKAENHISTQGDGMESDAPLPHAARGLTPILEPVQERKSEYGSEGFQSKSRPDDIQTQHSRDSSEPTLPSVEKRFSRSPELPDLSRLSGFGEDFFSPTAAHHADSAGPIATEMEDANVRPTLRTEPSFGFHTAVNTAFEDANYVPPTPSSRLGNSLGVGRSNSESTGTSGISPIMSRAPSGVMTAEARIREAEIREANTPAIAEVLEPASRRESEEVVTPQEAQVPTEEEDKLTPPARPHEEREHSFRPSLPGGWISYATNTSDRLAESDSPEIENTANSQVSPVREAVEDEETTPTALRHPLLSTLESSAVANAATGRPSTQSEAAVDQQSTAPIDHDDEDGEGPPPVPLKEKTHTSLSMDSSASDDETDRLRKEIVRSLSPRTSDVLPDSETGLQDTARDDRESYYLENVYDNYWNLQDGGNPAEQAPAALSEISGVPVEIAPILPLAARKPENLPETQPEEIPERRFSWEGGEEIVLTRSQSPSDKHVQSPIVQPPAITPSAVSEDSGDTNDVVRTLTTPEPDTKPRIESSPHENANSGSEAFIAGAALATGSLAAAATSANKNSQHEDEFNKSSEYLATQEDDTARPLSSPMNSLESHPINRHSATSAGGLSSAGKDDDQPGTSHTARLSLSEASTGYTIHTTLKDILKVSNAAERTRIFDDVRSKIAVADSGLSKWAMALKAEHPEYADIDGNYGGSVPFVAPSSRSKFSKVLNQNSNTVQQPYYQQYLNASSPTTSQPTSPRPAGSSGAYAPNQQSGTSGFSGGGPKITTQQVQAKSKEFLHTAGVFGGKGVKAGKGLLAKGKSRFGSRGGSGDKISTTTDSPIATSLANNQQRSFGHKRMHTIDAIFREDSNVLQEEEDAVDVKKGRRRSAFGFGNSGEQSSRFGGLGVAAGRFSRLGKPGLMGSANVKEPSTVHGVDFTNDSRGVHEMYLEKSEDGVPRPPGFKLNSSLQIPTRNRSIDFTAWAAREEQHRQMRSESGLSHRSRHSRSGSAMSGSRRDMSFFLADDDDVSQQSGSISYGESDENVSYGVAKPAPISKFHSAWDTHMASPILEGEEDSPLGKQGPSIVKLLPESAAARRPVPPATTQPVSTVKTPDESPITGYPQPDADSEPEHDDWVTMTPPTSVPARLPQPVPPPARGIPPPPVSYGIITPAFTPRFKVERSVDHHTTSHQCGMTPIDSASARQESPSTESPIPFMLVQRFSNAGMMTPEEVESPIIPKIFRMIKGDPPMQYARYPASLEPEDQDSPILSLPPISPGSTFGSLTNGWPGLSRSSSKGSKGSRASRKIPIAGGSGDAEEVPPMPPTASFTRPGTSESAERATERMKAVGVSGCDELSASEENDTIGALIAAGLLNAAFGDEDPSPIRKDQAIQAGPCQARSSPPDLVKETIQLENKDREVFSDDTSSTGTIMARHQEEGSQNSFMPPVFVHEQAPRIPVRPVTAPENPSNLANPLTTPEDRSHSPKQLTPATLVDESRVYDRLSKSSQQWVENAPMADSYVPPSHPPPTYPLPSYPGRMLEDTEVQEHRRSQRPDVRIDASGSSSPSLSTRATFNSSPIQHRSLPSYASPQAYNSPSLVRQTYNGFGPMQGQSSSSAPAEEDRSPCDLPAHLFQAPFTKGATFIPRQLTSEYEIPGVGPPEDEPPPSATRSSRRSAFFRELGGRFSKTNSLALGEDALPSSPVSRNNGTINASASSITSEDVREKIRNQSRRSSLFGLGLGSERRSSAKITNSSAVPATPAIGNDPGGDAEEFGPPRRGESMITHRPGSRRDALESLSESFRSPPTRPSPLVPAIGNNDKVRTFFGKGSSEPVANDKRAVPAGNAEPESITKGKAAKKPRFSKLHGLLRGGGKNGQMSIDTRPPATFYSTSSIQQTPTEYRCRKTSLGQLPILARLHGRSKQTISADENRERASSREEAGQRAATAHAVLTGASPPAYAPLTSEFDENDEITEAPEEAERDPEKEDLSMHLHPAHRRPPKQTPIFIEEIPNRSFDELQHRGRKKTKELQHDTLPIPRPYNIVRGDDNDPGRNNGQPGFEGRPLPPTITETGASQSSSQHPVLQQQTQSVGTAYGSPPTPYMQPQAYKPLQEDLQNLRSHPVNPGDASMSGAVDLERGPVIGDNGRITWQEKRTRRNVSREYLLARSPARPVFGQQRPYTLSLPEEEENSRHGQRDYSRNGRDRSNSNNIDNKGGVGLGLLGIGESSSSSSRGLRGIGVISGKVHHHLGLHPDLKRPDTPPQGGRYSPPEDLILAHNRDLAGGLPLREQQPLSHAALLLSPNSMRDGDLVRSNSEVSQMSHNVASPPLLLPPPMTTTSSFLDGRITPPVPNPSSITTTTSSSSPPEDIYNSSPIQKYHHPHHHHQLPQQQQQKQQPHPPYPYNPNPPTTGPNKSTEKQNTAPIINKRMLALEPEEKIVDIENQGRSEVVELAAGSFGRVGDDEVVMCATSYPGMEWNPYAFGEMEYD